MVPRRAQKNLIGGVESQVRDKVVVASKSELRNNKTLRILSRTVNVPDGDLLVSSTGGQDGLDVVLDLYNSRDQRSDHLFVSLNVKWLFNFYFADFIHAL